MLNEQRRRRLNTQLPMTRCLSSIAMLTAGMHVAPQTKLNAIESIDIPSAAARV